MMKIIVALFALVALAVAKPAVVAAPVVAAPAPVVTASSSQYYHRNFNTLAAYVAAPAAYVAPSAAYVAPSAAYVAPSAAYVAAPASYYAPAAPYVAAPAASYVLLFSTICVVCRGSGLPVAQVLPVSQVPAQVGPPTVLAQSSQYFQRTFNRLVAAPGVLEAPVVPVAEHPPVVPEPPATRPPSPPAPTQPVFLNAQPNVAIAVATAHAAAPVATVLLPPYPFGLPPGFTFPINVVPTEEEETPRDPEPTTTTTQRAPPQQPQPNPASLNLETFSQGLPSNQNGNFKQYYAPPIQQIPLEMTPPKPIKLKTSVEVVPLIVATCPHCVRARTNETELLMVSVETHKVNPQTDCIKAIDNCLHASHSHLLSNRQTQASNMYKIVIFCAAFALAAAKPSVAPAALVAAPAPVLPAPAPFVTATSSQYVARNYNSLVPAAPAAYAVAPAPYAVAPAAVAPAPYAVAPAPYAVAPAPYAAAPAPYAVAPAPYAVAPSPYYAPAAKVVAAGPAPVVAPGPVVPAYARYAAPFYGASPYAAPYLLK
ncbi:calphotin-like [Plutella xylostella]|uniref:calphotin-like n=1 Tax=Plutella xylostella TaxID=51655 RepID=UPI0020325657|nr:calphotin-like [Plutella xylostella]